MQNSFVYNIDSNIEITYKFATDIKNINARGGKVEWLGMISDRSQIDGIKFWILDEEHPVSTWNYYEWFWAIPKWEDVENLFNEKKENGKLKFVGDWVTYMMEHYGNITENDVDYNGIYKIIGSFDGADCTFYEQKDKKDNQVCIANVIVEKIEKIGSLPSFDKYPIKIFTGKSVEINLGSHPVGYEFKTVLKNAYDGKPNFAGHYTVIDYGCGSTCQRFVIVDNQNGKIYQTDEFASEVGIDFRLESNLLIINPPSVLNIYRQDNEKNRTSMSSWEQRPSRYYKWTNNKLISVYP